MSSAKNTLSQSMRFNLGKNKLSSSLIKETYQDESDERHPTLQVRWTMSI